VRNTGARSHQPVHAISCRIKPRHGAIGFAGKIDLSICLDDAMRAFKCAEIDTLGFFSCRDINYGDSATDRLLRTVITDVSRASIGRGYHFVRSFAHGDPRNYLERGGVDNRESAFRFVEHKHDTTSSRS
jgi:hypothetical protein